MRQESVKLVCNECNKPVELSGDDVTIEKTVSASEIKYTATVVVDGQIYTDTQIVKLPGSTETGDNTPIALYMMVMLIAAAAVVVVLKKKEPH